MFDPRHFNPPVFMWLADLKGYKSANHMEKFKKFKGSFLSLLKQFFHRYQILKGGRFKIAAYSEVTPHYEEIVVEYK